MGPLFQYAQTFSTRQMRRLHLSRSFIAPEVGLSCLSCNLAHALPELLMAQGVITGHGVGAGIRSEGNDRKRAREGGLPGPSKRRAGSTVKKEAISANARTQRIQALQVSRVN
jgi:hypothetical protein